MFNIYWGCHFSRKPCESEYNVSFRVLINDTGYTYGIIQIILKQIQ